MEPYTLKSCVNVPEGTFLCYWCRVPVVVDKFGKGLISIQEGLGVAICTDCLSTVGARSKGETCRTTKRTSA